MGGWRDHLRRAWRKVRVYPKGRTRYPRLENLSLVRAGGTELRNLSAPRKARLPVNLQEIEIGFFF